MLTKAQSVFDSTTPSEGDAVAAYLFATNRLTSAAVGGNESLRTIAALQDGAGTALTSTLLSGKQSLDVNVTGFSATTINVDGTVADNVTDADNPVKTGSKTQSGLLAAITAGKRADTLSDLYRRTWINDAPNVGNKVATITVGAVAASIGTALAGRTRIMLQNNGTKIVYLGTDATVTADTAATGGLQIPAHGGTLELPTSDNLPWFAIGEAAGQKVAVVELG